MWHRSCWLFIHTLKSLLKQQILVANPAESTQIMTKFSHSPCIHIYVLHTHKLTHMYGWTRVVLLLKNLFFSRGSAQSVLRLHVHLISKMTQEHVKGLKSLLHSKRLPVLLWVLYELALKSLLRGKGGNGAIKCVRSHCCPRRQILKLAEVSNIETSNLFLWAFFFFFFFLVLSSERCLSYNFENK